MAERDNQTKSDGKLKDSDLIGWLIGFLFIAIIVGGIFNALQESFGVFLDDGMGIGATVSADGTIDVWEEPDGGELLGQQEHGALGEVLDGPVEVGRSDWWYVDFEVAPDGWVEEDDLKVEKAALKIGDIVEMVRTAGVWDQIGGGASGGLQHIGALGELIEGPGLFNGERWWRVDFDEGADGWVRETDIRRAAVGIARLWSRFLDVILLPSVILSVLLFASVVVLSLRIRKLVLALKEKYQAPETDVFVRSSEERSVGNERWGRVQVLVNSPEPANWRLAVIEADILLNDIVSQMGYEGETLGEQLKQVEKSDFVTLDKAWEAHKIRNTIAHEGGDFILTQREAKRIVNLYKDVFEEFHYI